MNAELQFGMFFCFSVSSREPLNAYAAMGLWGYRGVSGFYDPAIRPLSFLRRDPPYVLLKSVSRRREKKGRLRRDDYKN